MGFNHVVINYTVSAERQIVKINKAGIQLWFVDWNKWHGQGLPFGETFEEISTSLSIAIYVEKWDWR